MRLDNLFKRFITPYFLIITLLSGCVNSNSDFLDKSVQFKSGGSFVRLMAPKGFCVDKATLRYDNQQATFFIINCVGINKASKTTLFRRPVSTITSVSVSNQLNEKKVNEVLQRIKNKDLNLFSEYYSTNFKLDRKNSYYESGVLYLLLEKKMDTPKIGTGPFFWKAIREMDKRIVILTSQGFSQNPKNKNAVKIIQRNIKSFVNSMKVI